MAASAMVTHYSAEYTEAELARREAVKKLIQDGPSEGNVVVVIETDEWYPVYDPKQFASRHNNDYTLSFRPVVEVPGEAMVRWKEAFDAFKSVQNEIRAFIGEEEE